MTDHDPSGPTPSDFGETAERSQAANIADESAGCALAAANPDSGGAPDAEPGVAEPIDETDTPPRDDSPDTSDSIEPFHIPGSAKDIEVAGETGPGPSG
jgi:hypothetical protein